MVIKPSESKLRIIRVKYGDEVFKFDLFMDLKISVLKIQAELKTQPSNYAFAQLIQKKLLTRFHELKEERKALWARLYLKAKDGTINGRIPSDDYCNAKVQANSEYKIITRACIMAKDQADSLYAVVKGFEQRKDLLQTISSNNRKEI